MGLAVVDVEVEAVALVVSLIALLVSVTSLWQTALKPADIVMDHLESAIKDGGGGENLIPDCYRAEFTFAISNEGARAGLLRTVEVASVSAKGYPEFATGVTAPRHASDPGRPYIYEVGQSQALALPATVEPGVVRSVAIKLQLEGEFYAAFHRHSGDELDKGPMARRLTKLESVELAVRWTYRHRRAFRRTRHTETRFLTVVVAGERFRDLAEKYWDGVERRGLVGILRGEED